MSNRTKIELISQLLQSSGHSIEVFSHGEVIEPTLGFYPGFAEPRPFHRDIPIHYVSALAVPRLNGFWAGKQMVNLLRRRHRAAPFDVVIIFNLKAPQLACANYAARLGIPVVLEYEDDIFHEVEGQLSKGLITRYHHRRCRRVIAASAACIAVSPYLLSQAPSSRPKLLLRGVVGHDVLAASERRNGSGKNIVLFSGTHQHANGVGELINGWRSAGIPDWELHITGHGGLTESLRKMAENIPGIVFHGLVSREELVSLMCSARICINPHAVSQTPGNVFAFKIIEYLASGAHTVTTAMGTLEPELEAGITYMIDNRPETIAATLKGVIVGHRYEANARDAAQERYGPKAVSEALEGLLRAAVEHA